jgi:hypothetical protein
MEHMRITEPANDRFEIARVPGGHPLYAFRVRFPGGEGRCFITAAEAGRLSQLTADWVSRALANLRATHGNAWLKESLQSNAGLQLRTEDASDLPPPGGDPQ